MTRKSVPAPALSLNGWSLFISLKHFPHDAMRIMLAWEDARGIIRELGAAGAAQDIRTGNPGQGFGTEGSAQ